MSGSLRSLLAASLIVGTIALDGCKRSGEPTRHESNRAQRVGRSKLPAPLPLPAEPALAAYVARPDDMLTAIAAYVPQPLTAAGVVDELLDDLGLPALESKIAAAVDPTRAWAAATLAEESVLHLPIRKSDVDGLAAALSGYSKAGDFGAVELPAGENGTTPAATRRLTWLDESTATITIAESERGLATGPELAGGYGRAPVYLTIGRSLTAKAGAEIPFERLVVQGEGLHQFTASVKQLDLGEDDPLRELAPGALTGLLEAQQIAWGASSRYASHQKAVAGLISQVNARVREQNFLVRGILEDLVRRLNAMLRSWNGRVMIGGGPGNHLLLGLGADDPAKAERAVLHFVRGVLDNLKLAGTFGLPVPTVRLRKSGTEIHILDIRQADDMLPTQASALVDDRGTLHVAMAFPAKAGGAMFVIGPRAEQAMTKWIEQSSSATPAAQSEGDLLVAVMAIAPASLQRVLGQQQALGALGLDADRDPTRAVLRREGDELKLTVVGPNLGKP